MKITNSHVFHGLTLLQKIRQFWCANLEKSWKTPFFGHFKINEGLEIKDFFKNPLGTFIFVAYPWSTWFTKFQKILMFRFWDIPSPTNIFYIENFWYGARISTKNLYPLSSADIHGWHFLIFHEQIERLEDISAHLRHDFLSTCDVMFLDIRIRGELPGDPLV